jgi:uncharacterized protein (DUF427 family)
MTETCLDENSNCPLGRLPLLQKSKGKLFMRYPLPIQPGAGQESVWNYPRPPLLERTTKHLMVLFNGEVIAETNKGYRLLETSHPPVYYFPPADVFMNYLKRSQRRSFCEYKGAAYYYDVVVAEHTAVNAAWAYSAPPPGYKDIKDFIAFYAHSMEACYVDGEKVIPQPGGFYGGWITADIVGPFKGGPGSGGW